MRKKMYGRKSGEPSDLNILNGLGMLLRAARDEEVAEEKAALQAGARPVLPLLLVEDSALLDLDPRTDGNA